MRTARTFILLGDRARPRAASVMREVEDNLTHLTDQPRCGGIRFIGYGTPADAGITDPSQVRVALYEADYPDDASVS
jgi:hypothetical protein